MDAQLGRVFDALDRLGLTGNTVIIFTSDHGYHLADHQLWQKPSLFERCTRVPLIIAAPHRQGNGQVSYSLAELVDLYPTITDLCGLPVPDYLAGKSLRPILDDVKQTVKDAAVSQMRIRHGVTIDGYTVRTARWRYTEWDGGRAGKQLFDMDKDPLELTNLADDPQFAQTMSELSATLARIRAE